MSAQLINGADVILVFRERFYCPAAARAERISRDGQVVYLTALNAFRLLMNVYLPQGSRQVR